MLNFLTEKLIYLPRRGALNLVKIELFDKENEIAPTVHVIACDQLRAIHENRTRIANPSNGRAAI